ncbi:MAG: SGNH/GDSL hydrolase family protein [Candidatus Peregrinibacteria bacterium]|nr:SGNH/GDSL hydrolase family protein [Candidatus Peregrinibacteria bacterium]MCB9808063.1 SGNH/GDSL hydrolase family protein [Candidatus Peribacteria bacterium]
MKRDLLINGSLAVTSLLIFTLAIEYGLRVTGLQTVEPNPPKIYVRDENPHISYKLKPNLKDEPAYKATVSTDEFGMRESGNQLNVNSQLLTVILGDSIAFGYGVNDNETLASQLSVLSSQLFINAAVPGYQLEQERALYEDYVQDLKPDAVMIVFFWNDLDGLKPGILDDDGILRGYGWKPGDDTRPWLERHSAFYKAFRKLMSLRASKKHQEHEREHAKEERVSRDTLEKYVQDLRAFATILPQEKFFVIWPDNFLHEDTKPILTSEAKAAGFTVIDLYELFGNHVETLGWDTVHPSLNSIKQAADFIAKQIW